MVKRRCERLWEVDALREGRLSASDRASAERHRAACEACESRFVELEALRHLAAQLPLPTVDDLEARRRRQAVLRDAASGGMRPVRARSAAWAIFAAIVVIAVIGFAARPPAPAARLSAEARLGTGDSSATITASAGARWSRGRLGRIERVLLEDGALHVRVRHQRAGEAFLIGLPDGELEVRGTEFDVAVDGGRTASVEVQEGVVALRLGGSEEIVLRASDTWPTSPQAPPGPPTQSRDRVLPSSKSSAVRTSDADALSEYSAAMTLYRAGQYKKAATAFHAFASRHAASPESEDAFFLEAVSLSRAGRPDAAAVVAERFLVRYPRSLHARDAAILVARAARDRGACDEARAAVAPWAASGDRDLAQALGRCAADRATSR